MKLSSFWHNTGAWQTDGRTGRQTDGHVALAKTRAVHNYGNTVIHYRRQWISTICDI